VPWPLPLAPHRPGSPIRARRVSPPHRPTCGRAAVPWPAPTRRGRSCPHRDLYCPSPRIGVQGVPTASKLAHKRVVAVPLRATQRHRAAIAAASRRHGEPVLRPLALPNCAAPIFLLLHESPTLACWPARAAGSPEQSSQRPPPRVSAVSARRRCVRHKRAPPPGPLNPWTLPSHFPGRARRRGCRNFTGRAAPKLQGLHCKASSVSGVFCANQGPCCETLDLSRVSFAKCIFTSLCVLAAPCKIHNKSQKNQKMQTQFFCA
jgi:hypothetical protein